MYVNGVLMGQRTDVSPNLPNSTGWTINGRQVEQPAGGLQFSGLLDDVKLMDQAVVPPGIATASTAITVNGVADQPSVSTPANATTSENASSVALGGMTISTDGSTTDNADSFSATLSVGNGTLAVGAHGSASLTGGGTGLVTLTGLLTDVNTGLGNVSYTPTSEFEGTDTLSFSATATDGSSTSTVASSSASITVNSVADKPSVSTPANATTSENASNVALGGMTISTDGSTTDNADTFSATLSVGNGTLAVGAHGSASLTGSGSGLVTLTGLLADVNTGLGNVSYTPTAEFEGTDTLTLSATSTDGSSTSAAASSSASITVNGVADKPTVFVGSSGQRVAVIGTNNSDVAGTVSELNAGAYFPFTATGYTVNSFSSQAAWDSALASYDVVVTGASGFSADGASLSSPVYAALQDFVNSGKGVITTGWYLYLMDTVLGAPVGSDMDAITPLTPVPYNFVSSPYTITITNHTHPITVGLPNITTGAFYWETASAIDPTAVPLATENNGQTAIAYEIAPSGARLGYLGGLYLANSSSYNTTPLRTGAPDQLLEQAVHWAANDAGARAVNESSSLAITGLSVSPGDGSANDAADTFTATLSVGNGTLAVGAHGSASLTGGGTGTVTLSGLLADVNTGLSNVTYTAGDFEGTDTLTLSATATDGSSTSTVASSSATIAVNAVADKPSVSTPANATTSENASSVALGGMTVTTDGSTSDNADTFSATLSVGNGTLAVGAHGSASLTGGGTGLVTLSGTLSDVNTGLGNVSYTPTSEFEGTDTLSFSATATDGSSTSTVASSSASITVNGVADAPAAGAPASASTNENTPVTITTITAGTASGDGDDALSMSLNAAFGTLSFVNGGANLTITSNGSNGTLAFSGSQSNISTALASGVTYTPNSEFESIPYTTRDDTPTFSNTQLTGINDSGQIVGISNSGVNTGRGVLYSGGFWTTLNAGETTTNAEGINNAGKVVGYYSDGTYPGNHGFLYSGGPSGTYSPVDYPGAPNGTIAMGINTAGVIVGFYDDLNKVAHAFVDNANTYSAFDDPSADTSTTGRGTFANSINASGRIVGTYIDSSGTHHGFLATPSGGGYSFTTLDDPLANGTPPQTVGNQGTYATGIDDAGQIVGFYWDTQGQHGFVLSGGVYTTLNDPSAVYNGYGGTAVYGMNNFGQMVGTYAGSVSHGFVVATDTLSVTATDTEANNTTASTTQTTALTVNQVADKPAVSTPNSATTSENQSVALNGLTVTAAANDTADIINVTLSVANGTVALASHANLSGTFSGSNITLSGLATDLNTALGSITYTPNSEFEGTDSLSFTATSTEESGGAPSMAATSSASITVNGVADKPAVSTPDAKTTPENQFIALTGLSVTSANPGTSDDGDTYNLTLSVLHGTVALNNTSGLVGTNSGSTVSLSGSLANINAALALSGNVTYTPTSEFEGTDTLSFSATSTEESGGAPSAAATSSAGITVNGVADTPSTSTPNSATTHTAHAVGLTGLSITAPAGDVGDTYNVSLSVGNGTLSVGSTAGLSGTFSGASISFSGSLSAVTAALADNDIQYTSNSGFHGTDTLHFQASSTEEAGGAASPLSADHAATITVQGNNVLLSGLEMNSTIQSDLSAYGITSTIVSSSQLQNTDFSPYSGIWLSWSTTYDNTSGQLASKFSNFINSGGNVFAEEPGSNELSFLPNGGSVTTSVTNAESVHIVNTWGSLMNGLTDAGLSNWGNSFHDRYVNIGSFTGIATDSSSGLWVTIGESIGQGNLVITGQDPSFHVKNGQGATGAGSPKAQFAVNALELGPNHTDPPVPGPADVVWSGGTVDLISGTTLEFGANSSQNVAFDTDTPGGVLLLDSSATYTGHVALFAPGFEIDLRDIAFGASTTLGYSGDTNAGTLTVSDSTHGANIAMLGSYMASSFATSSDGHGGTLISGVDTSSGQVPLVTPPH